MAEQIISVRVSGALREAFNQAMADSGTNASEFLRETIRKRVEGVIPGPQRVDPVEEAKSVLMDEYWAGTNYLLRHLSNNEIYPANWGEEIERLRNICEWMAFTVLKQDELLRKFEILAEKSTNERGNIMQEFAETRAPRKPPGPTIYSSPLPSLPYDVFPEAPSKGNTPR